MQAARTPGQGSAALTRPRLRRDIPLPKGEGTRVRVSLLDSLYLLMPTSPGRTCASFRLHCDIKVFMIFFYFTRWLARRWSATPTFVSEQRGRIPGGVLG